MADRFAAEMWIGGTVTRDVADELADQIRTSDLGTEWGEHNLATIDVNDDIFETCTDLDGTLRVCDAEARFGELEDLEEFCRENKISYDRRSEGKYEYDPELVRYRPATGVDCQITVEDGRIIVEADALTPIQESLAHLITHLQAHGITTREDVIKRLDIVQEKLKSILPPEIPALHPFKIED